MLVMWTFCLLFIFFFFFKQKTAYEMRISDRSSDVCSSDLDIARNTSVLIGGDEIVDEDVIIEEDYAYPAYGVPSQETLEAIRLSARHEGLSTYPVADVKSMQGMIDLLRKAYFTQGSKVLSVLLCLFPTTPGSQFTIRK